MLRAGLRFYNQNKRTYTIYLNIQIHTYNAYSLSYIQKKFEQSQALEILVLIVLIIYIYFKWIEQTHTDSEIHLTKRN